MNRALISLVIFVASAVGCTAKTVDVGASTEAIVGGTPDFNNHPAVILLFNARRGAQCTGAIVAPRAVLTAKHCVQGAGGVADTPDAFRVYTGSSVSALSAEYRVSEVIVTPGPFDLRRGNNTDVAMLILSTPAVVEPMVVSFTNPRSLIGDTITAVGFGQTPSGGGGTKLRTNKRVQSVLGDLIFVEPAVCQGDSGGPLIGPDGLVYGVASFIFDRDGSRPTCGTAEGVYNAWGSDEMRQFVMDGIMRSGSCVPDGEEVCDGDDNNCDEVVDEGCIPLGEPCTSGDECVGGVCGETPIGRVCTEACTPLTPELGCSLDFYCARTSGCDGLCTPKAPPAGGAALGNDADCTADTDCASLFCGDPGDGRRRCLTPCEGDTGTCISGEACVALPGTCGGCVPAEIVSGLRGLGEPCAADGDCRSGSCLSDAGLSYCSSGCASDEECGAAFHCRDDTCVRGPRGGLGAGCVTSDDCSSSAPICAARGDTTWCTATCDGMCGTGFTCTDVGPASVCAPDSGLVGETCAMNEDCISGLCVALPSGSVCTETCGRDRACAAGFECVRTADGVTNACISPRPVADGGGGGGGGCSVSSRGRKSGIGVGAVFLALALAPLLLRRRRR